MKKIFSTGYKSATLILLGLATTACTPINYMQLKSDYIAAPQTQKMPEIIATATYKGMSKSAVTVAVKAPDQCTSYTADQRTGTAQASETILKTDCGLEMGEIERALAKVGYNVISWKAFNQKIGPEKNLTQAAQELGAQIIFQINSLENSTKSLGQDARWERSYFKTSPRGDVLSPLQLTADQRGLLASSFLVPREITQNRYTYAVTMDAAAIQVSNGQTIWYYRWTKASAPDLQVQNIAVNLYCDMSLPLNFCRAYTPQKLQANQNASLASGDTVGISDSEKPENIAKAQYLSLYREVVNNLVDSFVTAKVY